jgi:hypothetical protein
MSRHAQNGSRENPGITSSQKSFCFAHFSAQNRYHLRKHRSHLAFFVKDASNYIKMALPVKHLAI